VLAIHAELLVLARNQRVRAAQRPNPPPPWIDAPCPNHCLLRNPIPHPYGRS
jgi:hypothetical protein